MKAKIEFLSVPSKLSLVKLIKERFKLGLKESKDIVDEGIILFGEKELLKKEPKYVKSLPELPETNIGHLTNFISKLKDLNIEYNLEIIKPDKKMPFKEAKELQDIGKYVIVPIDVILKLKVRNSKKDEEIKKLKDSISSLEKMIQELESRKYDHLAIKRDLETILNKY